jgi:hypothetical protein
VIVRGVMSTLIGATMIDRRLPATSSVVAFTSKPGRCGDKIWLRWVDASEFAGSKRLVA